MVSTFVYQNPQKMSVTPNFDQYLEQNMSLPQTNNPIDTPYGGMTQSSKEF